MHSRAPKRTHPRRVGSTYLLSGLVKCHRCKRALSGQDAKSGQFAYYVCQSLIKQGSGACDSPRLNARRFEELVVEKIRSNILTEGSITSLVKVVDEEMDGIAAEQRQRLETVKAELEEVKRKLARVWHFIENSDIEMADASDRIREHRERQERLEEATAEARAILAERRAVLDDVETIAAYAREMRDFLVESELTERRAFIESFVKEIVVTPDDALLRYTVPMPEDSMIPGGATEKVALDGAVLPTVKNGGPAWNRTLPCRSTFEGRTWAPLAQLPGTSLRHCWVTRHSSAPCTSERPTPGIAFRRRADLASPLFPAWAGTCSHWMGPTYRGRATQPMAASQDQGILDTGVRDDQDGDHHPLACPGSVRHGVGPDDGRGGAIGEMLPRCAPLLNLWQHRWDNPIREF